MTVRIVADIYRCDGYRPVAVLAFPDGNMLTNLLYCTDLSMLCHGAFRSIGTSRGRCAVIFHDGQENYSDEQLEQVIRDALAQERSANERNLTQFNLAQTNHYVVNPEDHARARSLNV